MISKSNSSKESCCEVEYEAYNKIHMWRISIGFLHILMFFFVFLNGYKMVKNDFFGNRLFYFQTNPINTKQWHKKSEVKLTFLIVWFVAICVCMSVSSPQPTPFELWARDLKFGHSTLLVTLKKVIFFFLKFWFFPELCPFFGFPHSPQC